MLRPGVASDTIDETVAKLEAEFKAEVQQVGARHESPLTDTYSRLAVPAWPFPLNLFPLGRSRLAVPTELIPSLRPFPLNPFLLSPFPLGRSHLTRSRLPVPT